MNPTCWRFNFNCCFHLVWFWLLCMKIILYCRIKKKGEEGGERLLAFRSWSNWINFRRRGVLFDKGFTGGWKCCRFNGNQEQIRKQFAVGKRVLFGKEVQSSESLVAFLFLIDRAPRGCLTSTILMIALFYCCKSVLTSSVTLQNFADLTCFEESKNWDSNVQPFEYHVTLYF